jgi:hypothetical protein
MALRERKLGVFENRVLGRGGEEVSSEKKVQTTA